MKTKRFLKKLFSTQSGMSLMEVMVAMGLMGIVSLGVMKINENMIKGQRTIEQRSNLADFRNRLVRVFTNQVSCTRTLQGLNPAGTGSAFNEVWNVREDGTNATVIFNTTPGDPLNQFGVGSSGFLTINSLRIQGFDPATANSFTGLADPADITSIEPRLSGNARVIVQLAKPEGTNTQLSFGRGTLNFGIDVTVVVRQSDNQIVSCYADSNQFVQAMCTSLGGIYDSTDGRCKGVNIYAPGTITSTTEIPFANPFGITAENGLHASGGVYIGTGLNGPNPIVGLQPGNHGLGVDTLIPPDGQIAAASDINSLGGNITAGAPTVNTYAAQGDIAAESNIYANGSVNVGVPTFGPAGTITANSYAVINGTNLLPGALGNNAISAVTGDINAINGRIIANTALLRDCRGTAGTAGGTVVADENGVLSCVRGNTGSCPNIQIGNTVQIRAFVGYDNNGAPVCKTVMTFDNAACNQYSNPNNSTSNSVMIGLTVNANGTTTPNCCVKGTGCPSANTVCANGYDGVMDKCGFLCPGTKPQSVDISAQPLVYGCEYTNDSLRITRFFPEYQCGPPEDPQNQTIQSRSCYLGGNSGWHTYDECRAAGGTVYFYSKVEGQQCVNWPWLSPDPICWPTGQLATTGKEEDSFCMIPQSNMSQTTGRTSTTILASCFNCGNPITVTKSQIRSARSCPAGWSFAYDPNDRLVYQVAPYTCKAWGLAEGGNCFDNGRFPPSKTHTFTGGVYYAGASDDRAEWPGSYIEATITGEQSHIPFNTCSAPACDTVTRGHGSGCQDWTNSRHHWEPFSCYAPISGISCR